MQRRCGPRAAYQLHHGALHGAEGSQVHDALVTYADDGSQPAQHVEHHFWVVAEEGDELGRGNRGEQAVGPRDDTGGSGLVVDRGELAEEMAGAPIGIGERSTRERMVPALDRHLDTEIDNACLASPHDVLTELVRTRPPPVPS